MTLTSDQIQACSDHLMALLARELVWGEITQADHDRKVADLKLQTQKAIDSIPPSTPGAVCWEFQDSQDHIRLSFSIKVF